jgi:hypothetical protein
VRALGQSERSLELSANHSARFASRPIRALVGSRLIRALARLCARVASPNSPRLFAQGLAQGQSARPEWLSALRACLSRGWRDAWGRRVADSGSSPPRRAQHTPDGTRQAAMPAHVPSALQARATAHRAPASPRALCARAGPTALCVQEALEGEAQGRRRGGGKGGGGGRAARTCTCAWPLCMAGRAGCHAEQS